MNEAGCYRGIVSPHPPIIVSKIGGRETEKVRSTINALKSLSNELEKYNPDTIVVMSPHSIFKPGSFLINDSSLLSGSFQNFGFAELRYSFEGDLDFQTALVEIMSSSAIPFSLTSKEIRYSGSSALGHGILVPMHFLASKIKPKLAPISISNLQLEDHFNVGQCIFEAAKRAGRKAVFVASGDLSHRLNKLAPAGYDLMGMEFDSRIVNIFKSGDLMQVLNLSEDMIDRAGECGLRSIAAFAGLASKFKNRIRMLSYEGPFGVGYMVADMTAMED
jgi:aromatic ring-opening dioxygenase LigB subunit